MIITTNGKGLREPLKPILYSSSSMIWLAARAFSKSSVIVGFPLVNFLMVKASALSLANWRLRSLPISASLIFCKCCIDLSISSMANWNFSLAKR